MYHLESTGGQNIQIENSDSVIELQDALITARKTIEELANSNRLKDEFVAMATHQIRGPLGAIKGYVSLLLEGDYGQLPAGFAEPLNIIFQSTDSLGKTVNDFLDVARIEQREMKYYRKDFDFSHLLREVVGEMQKAIQIANLDLRLNISEGMTVHGDKVKLKHVILNLLDNSVKYTQAGWIEISLKKTETGTILLCIKDSGVGIKAETMPLLFQKFSRCTDAAKTNIFGTGLGLYVARKMLEAHNGRIWAESEGEGKGSQFYVELPLIVTKA